MDSGSLEWQAILNTDDFTNGVKRVDNGFTQLNESANKASNNVMQANEMIGKIGSNVSGLISYAAGFAGVALSAGSFVKQMINVRSEMQNIEASFKVFLGSAEKASSFMEELEDAAYWNVFEFKDLAAQSAQLLAYNNDVETVIPTIQRLSEVAAGNNVALSDLVLVWNKVKSQNKMDTDMVDRLNGMGIAIKDITAELRGVDASSIEASTIGFKELQAAIESVTNEGGKYYGMMEEKMKTLGDSIGLLQDNVTSMFNELGEAMQGTLKKGIEAVNSIVENYKDFGGVLAGLITTYGSYKTMVTLCTVMEKASVVTKSALISKEVLHNVALSLKNKLLTTQIALQAKAHPLITAITLALGTLVSTIILHNNRLKDNEKALNEVNERLQKYKDAQQTELDATKNAITVLQDKTSSIYDQIEAYKILEKYVPKFKGKSKIEIQGEINTEGGGEKALESAKEKFLQDYIDEVNKEIKKAQSKVAKITNADELNTNPYAVGTYREDTSQIDIIKDASTKLADIDVDKITKANEGNYDAQAQAINDLIQAQESLKTAYTDENEELDTNSQKFIQNKANIEGCIAKIETYKKALEGVNKQITDANSYDESTDGIQAQIKKVVATIKEEEQKIADLRSGKTKSKTIAADISKSQTAIEAQKTIYKQLTGKDYDAVDNGEEKEAQKKLLEEIKKIRENGIKEIEQFTLELMTDGKTKRLAVIESERQEALQALEKEKKELEKKIKESGGSGLSAEDEANYSTREKNINTTYDNQRNKEEKENEEYVKKIQKELTDVFVSEEQKRIDAIHKRYEEQRKTTLNDLQGGTITDEQFEKIGNYQTKAENYEVYNAWLDIYGNYYQKRYALAREWEQKIANVPEEFKGEAQKQMNEALTQQDFSHFKETVDWSGVFGNASNQSTSMLQNNINTAQTYLDTNQSKLGVDEIKELQEAITKMQEELDSRNPLGGIISGLVELKELRGECVSTLQELAEAQKELTTAQEEYNKAQEEYKNAQEELNSLDESTTDCEIYTAAREKCTKALNDFNNASTKLVRTENSVTNAQKKANNAQTKYNSTISKVTNNIGTLRTRMSNLGSTASDFASIFDSDVSDSISSVVSVLETCMDTAQDLINTFAQSGETIISSLANTASSTGTAVQSTATATASAIKTVESASVILAVISAALQVATAIANAISGDDEIDEEIENLQAKIDQLQWELDNEDTLRFNMEIKTKGIATAESVFNEFATSMTEVRKKASIILSLCTGVGIKATRTSKQLKQGTENWDKAVAKLVSSYASLDYSVGRVSGDATFDTASTKLENLSQQILIMRQQIEDEKSKKSKNQDSDKIQDWENNIKIAQEKMARAVDEAYEDLLGTDYQTLSDNLADSLISAFTEGEDAAEAWGDTVKDTVANVAKNILSSMISERILQVFNTYKKMWYDEKTGKFLGKDVVKESLKSFTDDLNAVGEEFTEIQDVLGPELSGYLQNSKREGTSKGIATASQESVDENNARLTQIQTHTYSLMMGMQDLLQVANTMLERVVGIENNTATTNTRLVQLQASTDNIKSVVTDFQLKGIKVKA